ncbi:MAG: ligase-associated DNA damage response DEXH box helicase [Geminicoccaceae bacterium]|nr:ligase-associated DNA damage response DEXH box helicase [Geminicoccaceae bacterium]
MVETNAPELPAVLATWFEGRGWQPRHHQLAMLEGGGNAPDTLLIAPTGGGKTLAGFLPSLVDLIENGSRQSLHTLYISPLKALTTDVARNLQTPVAEMELTVSIETRTGDTPQNRRQRQRRKPPDMLLTTPESLALLLSYEDSGNMFGNLRAVILDELHAIATSKRGALLGLGLARLRRIAPGARFIGLSATIADPPAMLRFLTPAVDRARIINARGGERPETEIALADACMPWSGHMALYATAMVFARIEQVRTALVFVNTRAQAELLFGALWKMNERSLPIALHHGSLAVDQRRKVEAAMARGDLRAVVCTSSLDLGIDWGNVDLVIQVGAPKGVSRLLQRIGRANHRFDEASRAVLVPANRFEVLECIAAEEAMREGALDADPPAHAALDVLAQHVLGTACAGPFDPDLLFEEVGWTAPYADLDRTTFDEVVEFVATGGYALGGYDRFRRLAKQEDGTFRLADPRMIRAYRMNVGTIVEAPVMRVRLGRGRVLGEIEEYFVSMLTPGDSFLFAGRLLELVGIRNNEVMAQLAKSASEPKIPAYAGGRLPLSSHLAKRVRRILAEPGRWTDLPSQVGEWLRQQEERSAHVQDDELLVETFERRGRHYLVAYGFAGRNAHQTLGMLLTRRLQRAGCRPLGFVASDYCIATWSLEPPADVESLFSLDLLGDDLEEWMAESSMTRRLFRNCAVVAGLIERRHPGAEKTGRQVTFNADLIYDVLRKHEPDHILLRAARIEAAQGLTDIRRLSDLLNEVQGRIRHRRLDRISPFAVSIIATIGRERVEGDSVDAMLDDITRDLLDEALP